MAKRRSSTRAQDSTARGESTKRLAVSQPDVEKSSASSDGTTLLVIGGLIVVAVICFCVGLIVLAGGGWFVMSRGAQSIRYGQTVTGQITAGDFEDSWTFYGEEGDTVSVMMSASPLPSPDGTVPGAVPGALDPYLELRSPSGEVLQTNDDGAGMLNSLLTYTLPQDGRYVIVATRYGGDIGGSTGPYSLTLRDTGGQTISYGESVSGKITASDYEQYWTFEGAEGETVHIVMDSTDQRLDSYIMLRDESGTTLSYNDDCGALGHSEITFALPADGTYTIVATRYGGSGGGSLGEYTLSLDLTAQVQEEEEQVELGEIQYGDAVVGDLAPTAFEERWTFRGSEGDAVVITMTSTNYDLDPYLYLYGPQGETLTYDDDSGGSLNSQIVFSLPEDGEYTIGASRFGAYQEDYGGYNTGYQCYGNYDYGNGTTTGQYRLSLDLAEDILGGGEISFDQPVEGTVVYGTLGERWTFTGAAGDAISISLVSTDGSLDPYLELRDAQDQIIAENDDGGGFPNSLIQITLPQDGAYTIVARGFGGSTGRYELLLTRTTPAEPISLTVQNQSGQQICYLYISPVNSGIWGGDWLTGTRIANRQSFVVEGLPPGIYNLRAETCQRAEIEVFMQFVLSEETAVWTVFGPQGQGVITPTPAPTPAPRPSATATP